MEYIAAAPPGMWIPAEVLSKQERAIGCYCFKSTPTKTPGWSGATLGDFITGSSEARFSLDLSTMFGSFFSVVEGKVVLVLR
jgi:hypothetical protein